MKKIVMVCVLFTMLCTCALGAQAVTLEEAKGIALGAASLTEADVLITEQHQKMEDGISVFSIEFLYNGNTEYDIDVDAASGAVVEFSWDLKGWRNSKSGQISEAEAQAAALAHAKVAQADAVFTKSHLDRDDGQLKYDLEFSVPGVMKYDYDIDATSGEVVEYSYKVLASAEVSSGEFTEEDAKAAALKHANLTESEVTFTKVKRERDDGRIKYEIEFVVPGKMEYEYDIDAETGAILEFDMERWGD